MRFDYVKYDEIGIGQQEGFKSMVSVLETHIEKSLKSPRAKALALTKLEEFYMWVGKAIRDDQINRNGRAEPQEERVNSWLVFSVVARRRQSLRSMLRALEVYRAKYILLLQNY